MPTRSRPIASPYATSEWRQMWILTAAIGTAFLVVLFAAYELVERAWLAKHYGPATIARLHMARGLSASIIVGTWTFLNVWRMRRRYDQVFAGAYRDLEHAMRERTAALSEAQAFSERLFDSLESRLQVLDERGRVLKANRLAIEAAGGDPIGKPCSMLGAACAPGDGCVARQAIHTGEPIIGGCVRMDPRTGRIFSVDAYPVPGSAPGKGIAIELARDITDAKKLEAQLLNQEKLAALGVLAAGIAHDIANPLASMSSELELLEEEKDLSRVRESAGVLRDQISRIDRTLREMTDFARRRAEDTSDVAVAAAVDDALRMIRHDLRARRVRFVTEVGRGLPHVHLVEDHLVMVLVNLLLNALDAMPEGGTITVRAAAVGDYVRISVVDTGKGMTEEVLRRAKEPLFSTKSGKGTGLGLSISADVMKTAGGSLDLDSTPGVGTTVHLTLPAERPARTKGDSRNRELPDTHETHETHAPHDGARTHG